MCVNIYLNTYMNVLILTPDAVGSTLLQRLVTIYMQFQQYNRPIINLHELTNGLSKYYSPDFNREIVGKPESSEWGYYQTLEEIVELLKSVDHYKTSRLAHYHLRNRKDSIADQLPFYKYLNENFFIISCRRENVFEHALSWGINKITQKINVYSAEEKISTFFDIYREPINVDPESIIKALDDYKIYLQWCDDHFQIASYFKYEKHLPEIEKYILNLPIFAGQTKIGFKDTYGIDLNEWNQCHYYISDIGSIAMDRPETFAQLTHQEKAPGTNIVTTEVKNIVKYLPEDRRNFVKHNLKNYLTVNQSIKRMIELGILISPVPIKKQTLKEKKFIVKNFDECVAVYNNWIEHNPNIGEPVTDENIEQANDREKSVWNPTQSNPTTALTVLPTNR